MKIKRCRVGGGQAQIGDQLGQTLLQGVGFQYGCKCDLVAGLQGPTYTRRQACLVHVNLLEQGIGVDCITGSARLTTPWTIEVDGPDGKQELSFRQCIIAAGSESSRMMRLST